MYLDYVNDLQCFYLYWFQFITNDQSVEVTDQDKQLTYDDMDFNENTTEGKIDTILLTDFIDVDLYKCCEAEGIPDLKQEICFVVVGCFKDLRCFSNISAISQLASMK